MMPGGAPAAHAARAASPRHGHGAQRRAPVVPSTSAACRILQANLHGALAREVRSPARPPCLELLDTLQALDRNVAVLSETWGDAPVPLPGWTALSRPRQDGTRKAGGVAVLVRNDLAATEIALDRSAPGFNTRDAEFIGASIQVPGSALPVHVVSVYLPKGATHKAVRALDALLTQVSRLHGHLIVAGDLNVHHPAWDQRAAMSHRAEKVMNLCEAAGLEVLNDGSPTHTHYATGSSSAPDVTLADATTASEACWSVTDVACGGSDHLAITVDVLPAAAQSAAAGAVRVWNVQNADWSAWADDEDDWLAWTIKVWNQPVSMDALYESFLEMFEARAVRHIGTRFVQPTRPNGIRARPPGWEQAMRPLLAARNRAHKRWRRDRTAAARSAWRHALRAAEKKATELEIARLAKLSESLQPTRERHPGGSGQPSRRSACLHLQAPAHRSDAPTGRSLPTRSKRPPCSTGTLLR